MFRNPDQVFKEAVTIRTYCRDLPDKGRKETVEEMYNRVLDAFEEYYGPTLILDTPEYDRAGWYELMSEGIALPAGRMLWAMGSRTIQEEGFLPLMNCSFTIVDDPLEPIRYIAKMLFLGCGVGFSLERKYFRQLQTKFEAIRVRSPYSSGQMVRESRGTTYRVKDSRDGWIAFILETILRAIRQEEFHYCIDDIRPAGTPIKGFGGRSGDPEILAETTEHISRLIRSSAGATVELYYDIICLVAKMVVSGNVRRSALIAIGDPNDREFLELKQFSKIGYGNTHRSFCNNSVNVQDFEQLGPDFWNTFTGQSEAYGWVNVEKCVEKWDGHVRYQPQGFNPCGEQPLADREVCCLGEINLAKVYDKPELFRRALIMTYLFCKLAYTLGAPTEPQTQKICQANQRIGISITGVAMVPNTPKLWLTLENMKDTLRVYDEKISKFLDVPPSIALTTVKPGGTLPKIAGAPGPGVHRPISRFQIRRVRFSKHSALLPWFREMGIPIEPEFDSKGEPTKEGTQVVSFYLDNTSPPDDQFSDWQVTPEGLRDMFQRVAKTQLHWSENSVSVTIYYNLQDVGNVLIPLVKEYFPILKCFSGLPYYGHNFQQAPEEPVDAATYYQYMARDFKPSYTKAPTNFDGVTELEDFGSCGSRSSCSDR